MPDVLLRDRFSRNGTRAGDVSYISLAVPDTARARRFYGTLLGWTFGPGQVEHEGSQVDEVIPQVGLWGGPQPDGSTVHGAVLGLRVDDLAAAIAQVETQGGSAVGPRREPYGVVADCVDDQGLVFYLHELPRAGQPAPPNGGRHGDISYVTLLVADPGRAQAFFAAVVGWRYSPGHATGGVNVEGPTPMIGMAPAGDSHTGAVLCYRVGDIVGAVARVRDAGGTATDPARRPYGLESDCTDDQQTPFYLHQFP